MITNELVSIIIPVYNTEKYLKVCIESVLSQTYKNLEIILVDDGSTDSSSKICDEFKKVDSRIEVIHKENGGLSDARNQGTKFAKGRYVVYLDSDDYLSPKYVEESINMCISNNADISIMQMCYIPEYVNEVIENDNNVTITLLNSFDAIKESLYQKKFSCCAPSKMYKKEILEGISFPVGKLSEDLAVCHEILGKAKIVAYSSDYGYYYRQHDTSIMHTFNPRRLDAIQWCSNIEEYCLSNCKCNLSAAKCRAFNVAIHLLLDLPDTGEVREKCYDKIYSEIVRTRKTVIFDKEVRNREKAAAFLSFFGEKILKKVWNSKIAIKQNGN